MDLLNNLIQANLLKILQILDMLIRISYIKILYF